jgi:hypothetical protein
MRRQLQGKWGRGAARWVLLGTDLGFRGAPVISSVHAIDGTHGDRCGAWAIDIEVGGVVQEHVVRQRRRWRCESPRNNWVRGGPRLGFGEAQQASGPRGFCLGLRGSSGMGLQGLEAVTRLWVYVHWVG